MPTKFKVFDTRRVPSAEPERVGKYDMLVMYELDPMRRYIVRIPEEEFNEARMLEAVKKDMAEREQYTGKEYEIP
ncbi:hypothetical protein ES705_13604 [subsurface metagenome]